jgi:hypothetical protein
MTRTATAKLVAGTFAVLCALGGLAAFVVPVAAHAGSLSTSQESLSTPTWLFLVTGGGAVGASFLLASFVTDRALIRAIHDWHRRPPLPGRTALVATGRGVGLAGLFVVIVVGFVGPATPQGNLAILLVWVGWWAGFTMSTYLLGNAWPALNPWRTISRGLPSLDREYPDRLGAWPSVVALLGLIWIEIVSPVASDPRLLAGLAVTYSIVTLAGAVVYGSESWFRRADPISRVFRFYGRVAPLTTEEGRIRVRLPGSALAETRLVDGLDEVAFVIALLWGTTFDGLVLTPAWDGFARWLVALGVPSVLLYPAGLAVGFAVFLGVYRLAARRSRVSARTYCSAEEIAQHFAPSLLAIAAGYHLAHYLDYFLSLVPSLAVVATGPLSPPATVPQLVLPGWFGGLSLVFVLGGHLLAIWVAHTAAYDLFPGRLQAIRSQYALTAVMIFYTAVSLWVVSQPSGTVPFV